MNYEGAYKALMIEYSRERSMAKRAQIDRRGEVFEKIPRLRELDELYTQNLISMMKQAAGLIGRNPDDSADQGADQGAAFAEGVRTARELSGQRRGLLAANGYPENYLTDTYACPACRDTGFVGGVRCACFKQRLTEKYYDLSNVIRLSKDEHFDNFDIRYYSEEIDKDHGISPYENIKTVYTASRNFIRKFGAEFQNLLFYGDTGLGKTFLCSCIARELLDGQHTVLYDTAPRIFKKMEEVRFNKENVYAPSEELEMLFEAELLILDDLGSEFATVVTNAGLFDVINRRIIDKRPTIISTNLSLNDLQLHYSDRIVSRLFGNYLMLNFFGEDIRVRKKLAPINRRKKKQAD